jgi:hypothetical protein
METSPASERTMSSPGLTIFVLFFGLSLVDALSGGNWPRALFWVGIGAAFWLLERRQVGRRP